VVPVDFDLYLFHDTVGASVVAQHQCSIALPSSLPWAVSGEQSGVSVMDAEQSSHLMTKLQRAQDLTGPVTTQSSSIRGKEY